jgi:hypothetical protein
MWLIEEQMTVASDWDDTTWQTHLDGYLGILSSSRQRTTGKARDSILTQALECAGDDATAQHYHSYGTMANIDKATLLLDVSKLRLRSLAQKLCMLLQRATPPRKLDVQKIQSSVKQIHADLLLITSVKSPGKSNLACTTVIEVAAVRVIAAGILVQCGQFLRATGLFNATRMYTKLTSSICVAADQICTTVAAMRLAVVCPDTIDSNRGSTRPPLAATVVDALSVIWPLFVVGTTAHTDDTHRTWARNILLTLGDNARIPKAFHLVSPAVAFESDLVPELEADGYPRQSVYRRPWAVPWVSLGHQTS